MFYACSIVKSVPSSIAVHCICLDSRVQSSQSFVQRKCVVIPCASSIKSPSSQRRAFHPASPAKALSLAAENDGCARSDAIRQFARSFF